jgi:hypothetical protein
LLVGDKRRWGDGREEGKGDHQWRKKSEGAKSQQRKGAKALDPTIREEEGAPPMVEVEPSTTLGVGMAAGGGDEDGYQEGRVEEMRENEWIRRRR